MPISIMTFTNLFNFIKSKFNNSLPAVDPSINGGLANAVSNSASLVGYSLQDMIQDAVNQSFIATQDDGFLAISGAAENIPQLPAQGSSGYAAVGGTLGTIISSGKTLSYLGLFFTTQSGSTISTYTGSIADLYYNTNGTVQASTNLPHTLSTGLSVTIAGAVQSFLNGTFIITVLDEYNFTYTISGGLTLNPDGGSYSSVYALLNLLCTTQGANTNVGAGSALSISQTNVNSQVFVGVNGLYNGTDAETIASWRSRILQGYNLTPGISTTPSELSSIKKVTGITREWIIPAQVSIIQVTPRGNSGYYPLLGETMIYVVADGLYPITPTSDMITACFNQLQTDGIIPNWIPSGNFWIISPNLAIPYISLHLTANDTTSSRTAIQEQLVTFFQENANVGAPAIQNTNVSFKAINTFIQNIQDPNTGLFIGGNYIFNGWGFNPNPNGQSDLLIASGQLAVGDPTSIVDGYLIFN